jgi:DNA-binding SARP family transcriptional activator
MAEPSNTRRDAVAAGGPPVWSRRRLVDSPELFERFPYGLVLVAWEGSRVINLNRKARDLLLSHHRHSIGPQLTCCELICQRIGALKGGCLSERAVDVEEGVLLPEIRMDLTTGHSRAAVWVTASPLDSDATELLFHLRQASPDDRRRRNLPHGDNGLPPRDAPALHILTLGRFRVESEEGPLGGEWLEQRTGELLKYLVCERRRAVANDRIADALWPEAGPNEARSRARYYVHLLRERLEPNRPKRSLSQFVVAGRGGYRLNIENVRIDADEFEHEVRAGLLALLQQGAPAAVPHLESAVRLYRDDFLAENPYAEWTLNERDRLRDLAVEALRALVYAQLGADQLDAAATNARRLAEMEPFDSDVQRTLIYICLKRGRRSEAVRRYAALRQRMLRSFGEEPDFALSEVTI